MKGYIAVQNGEETINAIKGKVYKTREEAFAVMFEAFIKELKFLQFSDIDGIYKTDSSIGVNLSDGGCFKWGIVEVELP